MAEEAATVDAAQRDIDKLDGGMPRLIAEAPDTLEVRGVVDVRARTQYTKAQLQSLWTSRKRVLQRQAGHVTKIEKIQAEAEARGSSLLQEINEGRVPDAIATKELPKNDRDKLPNVPAFRDKVRVLRA
jgi:ATP-dependent helicase/DNAse subunit B